MSAGRLHRRALKNSWKKRMEEQTKYGELFSLSLKNCSSQNTMSSSSNAKDLPDNSCVFAQDLSASLSFDQDSIQPSFLDEWDALECGSYDQFKACQEFIPTGSSTFFPSNEEDNKHNPSSFNPKDLDFLLVSFPFDEECGEVPSFINEWDALECGHLNTFKKFQNTKKEDCVLAKEDDFLDVSFEEVSLEELFSEEVLPTGSLFLANAEAASESSRVVQEISPELSLNQSDASLALVEQGLLIKVDNSEEITSDELPAKEHRTEDE